MIKSIIIEVAYKDLPLSKNLIGIKIPLAVPFCPIASHRFIWDEKTGKTSKNLSFCVKMDDLLDTVKNICEKTYLILKEQQLGNTLVLQSSYCRLSR